MHEVNLTLFGCQGRKGLDEHTGERESSNQGIGLTSAAGVAPPAISFFVTHLAELEASHRHTQNA